MTASLQIISDCLRQKDVLCIESGGNMGKVSGVENHTKFILPIYVCHTLGSRVLRRRMLHGVVVTRMKTSVAKQ